MNFRRLVSAQDADFDKAFRLYEVSFPAHEQRRLPEQAAVFAAPAYRFYDIYDEDTFVGIMLCWETNDFIYVEHFAIEPSLRGKQYGSRAMELLYTFGKTVILEIDPPVDEIARKRQHFYEKLGFVANEYPHVHPPYRVGNQGHSLVIMSYPKKLQPQAYEAFADYLRAVVMADSPA